MSSEEFQKPPASFAGAVLMMLTAAAMFACLDTTTKYLTRELPVMEVVWGRYLTHLILMTVVLGPLMRRRLVRYRRPGLQVLRALLMLGSTALAIWGFSYLPLAEAATIGFATPRSAARRTSRSAARPCRRAKATASTRIRSWRR